MKLEGPQIPLHGFYPRRINQIKPDQVVAQEMKTDEATTLKKLT